LALAAFLFAAGVPQPAQALTPEQSDALAAADQEGSEALARELAAQALVSPTDWPDLLDAATALDPDAATLLAATLAAVIPVKATEIAGEAGCGTDAAVCAAVAAIVPPATGELEAEYGSFDDAEGPELRSLVLTARKLAAGGRQEAAVSKPNTRVTIQKGKSELQDGQTPSPNN
jgi:hypothetical protein